MPPGAYRGAVVCQGWTYGGYFAGSVRGSVINFSTTDLKWTGNVSSALRGMSGSLTRRIEAAPGK
jgi:hypothetical protein